MTSQAPATAMLDITHAGAPLTRAEGNLTAPLPVDPFAVCRLLFAVASRSVVCRLLSIVPKGGVS